MMEPTIEPTTGPIRPIFLLADSQLLFWREGGEPFMNRVSRLIDGTGNGSGPKAAYIGASNGDRPEFFQLFKSAVEGTAIQNCRMIPSEPKPDDLKFIDQADLILLAGGDVRSGWRIMKQNGIRQKLYERYYTGAVLMGVSAGAVQLGLHGMIDKPSGGVRLFDTMKLVPFMIDAHAEPDWERLKSGLGRAEESVRGLGISSGSGAILHPDRTLEAIRHPLVELDRVAPDRVALDREIGAARESLIFPPGELVSQISA